MTWEVVKTPVLEVTDHPNADRLSILRVLGYTCISAKNEDGSHRYAVGDEVIYIPEASVLPGKLLYENGFWNDEKGRGILAGSKGNRVKALKLRGIISQGIIFPASKYDFDENWAQSVGIYKYEVPVPSHLRNGDTEETTGTISYDVLHGQKEVDLFDPDEEVIVTEKIHGTLIMFGWQKNEDGEVERIVSSKGLGKKGYKISEESEYNIYVKTAKPTLDAFFSAMEARFLPGERVLFVGEIYGKGIQDLHYSWNIPQLRIFDIHMVHPQVGIFPPVAGYLDFEDMEDACSRAALFPVPVLWRGKFRDLDIPSYRDGKSILDGETLREGIVVRSATGHKVAKFVSPDYLTRRGGTEHN